MYMQFRIIHSYASLRTADNICLFEQSFSYEELKMVRHLRGLGRLEKVARKNQQWRGFWHWKRMAEYVWWLKQDMSARMMQRIWRNKHGRDEFLHNMAAVAHKKLMQFRECVKLVAHQRHAYRSFYATRDMQAHIKAAYRAARMLQSQYRRLQALKEFRLRQLMAFRAEELEEAVLKVQCTWRCKKARELLRAARELRRQLEAMQSIMVLVVQRMYRGFKGRVSAWARLEAVLRQGSAVCFLQRAWRRRKWWIAMKKRFDKMRMQLLVARMELAEAEKAARMAAALLFQRYWYGWVARQWLVLRQRQVAWALAIENERARQIQRWLSDQQQRWVSVRRCRYRKLLMLQERRRALQLQVDWAARVAVFSVVQVQRRMRQVLARLHVARLFGALTVVYMQRKMLHKAQHRARQLQKFARHAQRTRRMKRLCDARRKILDGRENAAVRIQAMFRGMLDREVAAMLLQIAEEEERKRLEEAERKRLWDAAVKVQQAWRLRQWHRALWKKFEERRVFLEKQLLEAAIMVQTHWRAHVAINRVLVESLFVHCIAS